MPFVVLRMNVNHALCVSMILALIYRKVTKTKNFLNSKLTINFAFSNAVYFLLQAEI